MGAQPNIKITIKIKMKIKMEIKIEMTLDKDKRKTRYQFVKKTSVLQNVIWVHIRRPKINTKIKIKTHKSLLSKITLLWNASSAATVIDMRLS